MKKKILFILLLFIGSWSFAQDANCSFGLVLSSAQAEVGETLTVDVKTRQFSDILGLQYTHQWNPSKLELIEVVYHPENELSIGSFNFGSIEEQGTQGVLAFTFTDPSLAGINLPDNTVLYSLRFTYLQETDALVQISNSPTNIEIVHDAQNPSIIDNYYFVSASVSTSSAALPSINTACLAGGNCSQEAIWQINIDTEGGASFNWEGPNGFEATSEDIASIEQGYYNLIISSTNGQSVYTDFYLNGTSELGLSFEVDNDECGGAQDGGISSVVTGGGSGNYSYEWSNGSSTANLNGLAEGTYSLTVTDNDTGCSITDQTEVQSIVTLWITSETSPASCSTATDGSINITVDGPDGTAPFTYEWTNGATTEDLDNIGSGFYGVTIQTNNGCSASYAEFVEIDQPVVDAIITDTNCQNTDNGSIALDIEESDFDILWSNGETTPIINDLTPGTYIVSLTQLDNSCTYVYEYEVVNSANIPINYSLTCNDENAEIQIMIWDNTDAPYTIDWSTGEQTTTTPTVDGSINLSSILVSSNGIYGATVTGTSGCSQIADDLVVNCIVGSQVNLSLSPNQATLDMGDQICLAVEVDEFIDELSFQFTIEWDESLLSFTEVTNINVPDFNSSNYGTSLIEDGFLTVSWNDSQDQGLSLPASSSLFSICFDVVSPEVTTTTVSFENFPTSIEVLSVNEIAETVNTQDAQLALNGDVIPSEELSLTIGQIETTPGSIVCVPVKSSDFHGLGGLQFAMKWDADALIFNTIQNISLPIMNFNSLAERELDGILRVLWQELSLEEIYIADNTSLFEVCFTAQGEAGVYPIEFTQLPIPSIAGTLNAENIDLHLTNGSVIISDDAVNEGVSLRIATAGVDVGGSVCLPVYADNVNNLLTMQFSIVWDQELMDLNEVVLLDNLLGINQTDYNLPAPGGVLTFAWFAPNLSAVSLPAGTPIFELCFTASQQEGVAGVNFSNQPTNIEFIDANQETINFIPANGQLTISSEGLVWPGDTDVNASVNHFDLLNIGLAYGAQGAARNNASTSWLAQFVQPWEQSTPLSNVDYRFIDADGNGEINIDDIRAITQNWDETTEEYLSTDGTARTLNTTIIPFYIQGDTVQAGASVSLPIMLGVEDALAEDIYGLAFSIHYDPELVRPKSAEILFDGWLGTIDDGLMVYRDYHGYGRVDVAMVRTDGQNITNQGKIGEFIIVVEDVILRDKIDVELSISIDNVRLINAQEEEMLTSPRETTVLVENITNTNEAFELQSLQLSPNPTNKAFSVHKTDVAIQSISVFDSRGQLQQQMNTNADLYNIEQLPAGVYWLKFQTDKGIAVRKLIKL